MFGVGLIQGKDLLDMFLTAVSLAVAAIPEGLPAIVHHCPGPGGGADGPAGAIVKKLPAVETLGCAGVICSDKTGTLTQNRMTVQQVWIPAGGRRREALLAGCLCSDARLEWRAGAPAARGTPPRGALVVAAAREGLDKNKLEEGAAPAGRPALRLHPKAHVHRPPQGGRRVPGVCEGGARTCCWTGVPPGPAAPSPPPREAASSGPTRRWRGRPCGCWRWAQRDLAFLPPSLDSQTLESGLTFLGLFGLMDPPRPEAKAAVELCHRAGGAARDDHWGPQGHRLRRGPGSWTSSVRADRTLTGSELDFLPQELLRGGH